MERTYNINPVKVIAVDVGWVLFRVLCRQVCESNYRNYPLNAFYSKEKLYRTITSPSILSLIFSSYT